MHPESPRGAGLVTTGSLQRAGYEEALQFSRGPFQRQFQQAIELPGAGEFAAYPHGVGQIARGEEGARATTTARSTAFSSSRTFPGYPSGEERPGRVS